MRGRRPVTICGALSTSLPSNAISNVISYDVNEIGTAEVEEDIYDVIRDSDVESL